VATEEGVTDLDWTAAGLWTLLPQGPSIDPLPPAWMGTVQDIGGLVAGVPGSFGPPSRRALAERAALGESYAEPALVAAVAAAAQTDSTESCAEGSLGWFHPSPLIGKDGNRKPLIRKAAQALSRRDVEIPEGGGAPLAPEVRERMEGALRADLSQVSVHTGDESQRAAEALRARAFTDGSRVHFAVGEFAPGTREGDRLLAHELSHVAQGQQAGVHRKAEGPEGGYEVSSPDEPAEVEADAIADQVADRLHGGHGSRQEPFRRAQPAAARKIYRATTDPAPTSSSAPEAAVDAGTAAAPIDYSTWEVGKQLAAGGTSRLVELTNPKEPTEQLAMKILTGYMTNEEFEREFTIQEQLSQGPNSNNIGGVVALTTTNEGRSAIVMPLYKNGNLAKASQDLYGARFNDRINDIEFYGVLAYWTQGILRGLEHIHEAGLRHSDIKQENVMLDDDYEPKIIDFGLAAKEGEPGTGAGTKLYAPPEQLVTKVPTQKSDMFALGRTLQEMPRVQDDEVPTPEAQGYTDFVTAATQEDPELRPEPTDALQKIMITGQALPQDQYVKVMRSVMEGISDPPVNAQPGNAAASSEPLRDPTG